MTDSEVEFYVDDEGFFHVKATITTDTRKEARDILQRLLDYLNEEEGGESDGTDRQT